MRMRTLGGTGIKVSPYCLGAMMFGAWGNQDHDDSVRIIHAALDAGINFVDTADVYSRGESEEIVGQALRGRRDDVVLATKAHGSMGDDPNMSGNSRRWIVREVDNSPRRLQTDYIDLYQMHRPDPSTDRPSRSWKPSGPPNAAATSGSAASSRPTRSSPAGSKRPCCRRAPATAWA
jgi:aryl-alcohol dehydrogenase-like predicted oxidoreductase